MITCPQCEAMDGWIDQADAQGVHRLARCAHPGRDRGFQSVGDIARANLPSAFLDVHLTALDRRIGKILVAHRGRTNAIRSAELAVQLLEGGADPARREEHRRAITASIERLRTVAGLAIAATKEPPYGYFLPETDAEWNEMHERYTRELTRTAALARLFSPQARQAQRLRGQIPLGAETGNSKLKNREVAF